MGLNHRMLDNSVFLDLVSREMAASRPAAVFHRAELIGRELRLFYRDPGTTRKDISSDSRHAIAAGWVFTNQEERGKSVNAAPCLFTRFGVATQRPSARNRLSHARG
jgi:hypothetical protein